LSELGRKAAFALVLVSMTAFSALMGVAIWLYPGGSFLEGAGDGFGFFANALCDLLAPFSPKGQANPGVPFAVAAMLVFSMGLFPFFWLLPRLFPERPRLGALVRALGLLAASALVFVPLLPSQRFGTPLHAIAIFAAWFPGLGAAGLAAYALLASPRTRWPHGVFDALALGLTVICGLLYAAYLVSNDNRYLWVLYPLQKIGLFFLMAWIIAASAACRRGARPAP